MQLWGVHGLYGNQECFRAPQYVCCRARLEPRIHRRHRFLVGTENILNSATFAACARRSTIDRSAYAIPFAYCTLSLRSVCLSGSLSPSLPLSMHIGRLHAQLAFCAIMPDLPASLDAHYLPCAGECEGGVLVLQSPKKGATASEGAGGSR